MTSRNPLLAVLALLAAAALPLSPVAAQDGPPPHVRAAVDATMEMLASEGDAALQRYVSEVMTVAPNRDAAVMLERLRAVRSGARGRIGGDVDVERAPGGVELRLSGPAGAVRIGVDITEHGVADVRLVSDAVPDDGAISRVADEAAARHAAALERVAQGDVEEALRRLEREHFSRGFMARTGRNERRALVRDIREALTRASAVTLESRGGEMVVNLRGTAGHREILFAMEPAAPFGIDILMLRDAEVAALNLTPGNVAATFDELASRGFSGVVYIARDGETLLERAYGMANADLSAANEIDTVFGIGSTPITFTIAAIELLAQRGTIELDHEIGRYFDNVPADKRAITIRHLLEGRSGLPDFFDNESDWDADLAWIGRDEAVARMMAQPLLFRPGQSQAHSHGAFGLLAALIERVSGVTYYQFIRRNLLDPAGMSRTGLYGENRGLELSDFAVGPGPSRVGLPNIPPNWGPTSWLVMGSGGMYSTLDDMLRFFDYIRTSGVLGPEQLRRWTGPGVEVGGSVRGFYIFHAYNGRGATAMMLVNMEGRTSEMEALSNGLARLVGAEE